MVKRTCTQCRFFSPAPTSIGPSTLGYCARQPGGGPQRDAQNAQPAFTWSDTACDGFESGSQSVPGG